jgi:hypothetical protein
VHASAQTGRFPWLHHMNALSCGQPTRPLPHERGRTTIPARHLCRPNPCIRTSAATSVATYFPMTSNTTTSMGIVPLFCAVTNLDFAETADQLKAHVRDGRKRFGNARLERSRATTPGNVWPSVPPLLASGPELWATATTTQHSRVAQGSSDYTTLTMAPSPRPRRAYGSRL